VSQADGDPGTGRSDVGAAAHDSDARRSDSWAEAIASWSPETEDAVNAEAHANTDRSDVSRGLASIAYNCVAVVVADLDRASQWYQDVLGLHETVRLAIDGASVALLDGAGTRVELICGDRPSVPAVPSLFADPPDHLLPTGNKFLVFDVADLAVAGVELKAKGVHFVWEQKDLAPGFRSSAIRDGDGNFIHIFEQHSSAEGGA
jgi:catechol 2,3-dioxygenase-like lactoylglutathione lyase family enzyme